MSRPTASAGMPRGRRVAATALTAAGVLTLSGCGWVSSWFGEDEIPNAQAVNVFDVEVGQCFVPPTEVTVDQVEITGVPCDQPHRQEAYAIIDYTPPDGVQGDAFPGEALLADFAKAECAGAFEGYVGISYLDSTLYFSYLLPSARGWQEFGDRAIICFATTTGQELTSSVRDTKW